MPAQLLLREIAKIPSQRNVVAAMITANGAVVLARAQPAELSLFDNAGNRVWVRATRFPVTGGLTVCGDTIIALESDETKQLVRSRLNSGKELTRTELDIERGSDPFVLGCSDDSVVLGTHTRMRVGAAGLSPVQHPERALLFVSSNGELKSTGFVAIDSSIQITPPAYFGRSAMRPPFAPMPSLAFLSSGNVLYSSGTGTEISMYDVRGKPIGHLTLSANVLH